MAKKLIFVVLVCSSLALSEQASAFFVEGNLQLTVGAARTFVTGHSSKWEVSVTQLEVTAQIIEEGATAGAGSKYCARTGTFPELDDINCTAVAEDPSITNGCEYCGTGDATPYYYYISGTPETWGVQPPVCETFEPGGSGGGPGGGGDPP